MSGRRLLGIGLWGIGALIALAHLALLARVYPELPGSIPAFVDLSGRPILSMPTSPAAALRLPIMGLLLQGVCAVMARNAWGNPEETAQNRVVWAGVALVAAAKALLSTLDLMAGGMGGHAILRGILLVVSAGGVLMLLPSAIRLVKAYANTPGAYLSQIGRGARLALVGLLAGYVVVVLLPFLGGR